MQPARSHAARTPVATSSARCCPFTMACTAVATVHRPMEAASALPLPQGICAKGMAASGCQSGRDSMPCKMREKWRRGEGRAVEESASRLHRWACHAALAHCCPPSQACIKHDPRQGWCGSSWFLCIGLPAALRAWFRHRRWPQCHPRCRAPQPSLFLQVSTFAEDVGHACACSMGCDPQG